MVYEEVYEKLARFKETLNGKLDRKQIQELLKILSQHPDALDMIDNVFLDSKQIRLIKENGFSAETVLNHMADHLQIRTSNSLELTYKYYGYVRPITPAFLNQFLDEIMTRIQLETEYAEVANLDAYIERQEDKTTANELGQFC